MASDRGKAHGTAGGDPPEDEEGLRGRGYDADRGEKQITIEQKWQIAQDQGMHIMKPDGRQFIIYSDRTEEIGPGHPRWDELGHPWARR